MTEAPFSVCTELGYQDRPQPGWMLGGTIGPWEGAAEILVSSGVGCSFVGCLPLRPRHDVIVFPVHEGSRTDANNDGRERVQQVCQDGRGYAEGSMAETVESRNLLIFS